MIQGVTCGKDGSVDNHMEMGKKLLAAGQLADALSHFHAAVGEDTSNTTWPAAAGKKPYFTNYLSVLAPLIRWRPKELHGLLQQSHGVPGNGEVQVCAA